MKPDAESHRTCGVATVAPRVSVIVPNYNHAAYLERRLQTILKQTFQDFEIVILDDASTDGSRAVIERYRGHGKVAAIVYNKHNSGSTFVQWNKGIRLACGEYIWFAESDDYSDPAFLSTMVQVLDGHPTVGLGYCRSWWVDDSGQQLFELPRIVSGDRGREWADDFVLPGREMILRHMLGSNPIVNASAVVFRKRAYVGVGYAPTGFRLAGDWIMWGRMLSSSDFAFVASSLNYQTTHGGSVRSRLAGTARELWEINVAQHQMLQFARQPNFDKNAIMWKTRELLKDMKIGKRDRITSLWWLVRTGRYMAPYVYGYWRIVVRKILGPKVKPLAAE